MALDHIKLQFTTAQFQARLKARVAAVEALIAKATDADDRRKQAIAALGHTAVGGLHQPHDLMSPTDTMRAEIERLKLIHDNLVPDETFTVTADEALSVLYGGRGMYGIVGAPAGY